MSSIFIPSRCLAAIFAVVILFSFLYETSMKPAPAFAAPVSQKDAAAKVDAKFVQNLKLVELHLTLPEGTKLNYDAPWQLEFNGALVQSGALAKTYPITNLNKESLKYEISLGKPADASQANATQYRLVYFLCDKAVTWCKRIKAEGAIASIKI